jgi:hypothetical protein
MNIIDGRPTGLLNKDSTLMEIHCLRQTETDLEPCGTRWVPISEEVKAQILRANNPVISMGAEVTPEMAERIYVDAQIPAALTNPAFTGSDVDPPVTAEEEEEWARRGFVAGAQFTEGAKYQGNFVESTVPFPLGSLAASDPTAEEEKAWCATFPKAASDLRQRMIDVGVSPELLNVEDTEFATTVLSQARPAEAEISEPDGAPEKVVLDPSTSVALSPLFDAGIRTKSPDDPDVVVREGSGSNFAPPEHSGFNVNYYSVPINNPKRPERAPYIFEVEDLIQALNLGFHEGTILKSLVRSATERELGLAKKGGDAIRDAEKMVHSSQEHLRALKLRKSNA